MRREHRHIHVYIEKQPVTRAYAGFYKYRGLKMEIEGGGLGACSPVCILRYFKPHKLDNNIGVKPRV